MKLRKLPKRYAGIVMPLILSLLMTSIVSAISVMKTGGFHADFPDIWLHAWGLSWLIAFPVLLFVLPLVRRIVMALVQN